MAIDQNKSLSPHFKVYEFLQTSKKNVVDPVTKKTVWQLQLDHVSNYLNNLTTLSNNVLEPIRAYMVNELGFKSLKINSGVRCLFLNNLIGGSKTSQHCSDASAVDINVDKNNNGNVIEKTANATALFLAIKEGKVDGLDASILSQVILEGSKNGGRWLHVAIKTPAFLAMRKAAKRNYTNFPEYFIYIQPEYLLTTEENLKRYVDYK